MRWRVFFLFLLPVFIPTSLRPWQHVYKDNQMSNIDICSNVHVTVCAVLEGTTLKTTYHLLDVSNGSRLPTWCESHLQSGESPGNCLICTIICNFSKSLSSFDLSREIWSMRPVSFSAHFALSKSIYEPLFAFEQLCHESLQVHCWLRRLPSQKDWFLMIESVEWIMPSEATFSPLFGCGLKTLSQIELWIPWGSEPDMYW